MLKRILYLGLDPSHYTGKGEITHWPIIQIIPRPLSDPAVQQTLKQFDRYSHILITSKSTVAILSEYLSQLEIDLQIWRNKVTIAVGQVTAKHLKKREIVPTYVAQEETAEGMIKELQQLSLAKAHVFWPHSAQARPLLKDFLTLQKIHHTTCVLYEPKPQLLETLPQLENFDEIVFTSPSTVKAFIYFFGALPPAIQLTAIGPITKNYLEELPN